MPPKSHTKNRPFFLNNLKGYDITHTIFKSGILIKIGFESDGSSVIVDNSANSHILSEEYMFTDKIDPIISNGMTIICRKYLI